MIACYTLGKIKNRINYEQDAEGKMYLSWGVQKVTRSSRACLSAISGEKETNEHTFPGIFSKI